jgi:y4mF family transcriptional regulator
LGCKILFAINIIPFEVQSMTENLAAFVKHRRKKLKITQVELAERAGVGLRFLRELEQGKPTLRLDKVNQVLDMFGYEMTPAKKGMNHEKKS